MAYTTIKKPSDYFNTKLYTGNGSTQSVTGVGFQPDFAWIKNRTNVSGFGHRLLDSIREVTKELYSNANNAENTITDSLTSFDTDGFSFGGNTGVNGSGDDYVAWNWLCNTSISQGVGYDATATVKANLDTNMAIATYTGDGDTTSSRPLIDCGGILIDLIIYKRLDSTSNWCVQSRYGTTSSTSYHLRLNTTDAEINGTGTIGNFGSSGIRPRYTNANDGNNINSANYVAYVFGSKKGFSKIGTYTGNGNADGTFVYTGFKPAFVMVKNTNNATADWTMFDVKRNTYNIMDKRLRANLSNAEDAPLGFIDFTSNGFKWRTDSFAVNGSGNTMIYMAFAEEPLVGDNPCTAR